MHGLTIAGDLYHALTIKRPPGALAFLAGNSEVTAANNGRLLARSASAFDFAGILGVELKLTESAISLDKLHTDDVRTSVEDELLDAGGFVHGGRGSGTRAPDEIKITSSPLAWSSP